MAPLRQRSIDAFESSQDSNNNASTTTAQPSFILRTWMVVLIIAGVLLFVTLLLFIILYFLRRRRLAQAARDDHTSRQRALLFRKRNISAADRAEAEELERSLMIRKSLASRTWSLSARGSQYIESPRSSRSAESIQMEPVEQNVDTGETSDDWKEWEAQVARERTNTDLVDPAFLGRGHPAFSPELEQVAVPQQPKIQTAARSTKGIQANPLPPIHSPPPYEQDAR